VVGILLDTCVRSEIQRPQGNTRFRAQVASRVADQVFLSVITAGELTMGIALLPARRRRQELANWLMGLEQRFGERILPVNADVARRWGELTARAQTTGTVIPASDGLIAATASWFGLHVMTRNSRHFVASDVTIIDPWQD
jgi:predicted nucleic acid-binding protein